MTLTQSLLACTFKCHPSKTIAPQVWHGVCVIMQLRGELSRMANRESIFEGRAPFTSIWWDYVTFVFKSSNDWTLWADGSIGRKAVVFRILVTSISLTVEPGSKLATPCSTFDLGDKVDELYLFTHLASFESRKRWRWSSTSERRTHFAAMNWNWKFFFESRWANRSLN